jgi:hypothetical protein
MAHQTSPVVQIKPEALRHARPVWCALDQSGPMETLVFNGRLQRLASVAGHIARSGVTWQGKRNADPVD